MDNRGNAIFSFMFNDDSDDEEHHQRVIQAIAHHTSLENEATKHGGSVAGREYKNREREDRHRNLMSDYFVEMPHFNTTYFRRRFRMRKELFYRILNDVVNHEPYFLHTKKRRARWAIVRSPARMWCKDNLHLIMMTCIILHNMIVEDEYEYVEEEYDDEDMCPQRSRRARARQYELEPSIIYEYHQDKQTLSDYMICHNKVRSPHVHRSLRHDLINHLWRSFGNGE